MLLTPLLEGTPEGAYHCQGLFMVVLESGSNAPQKMRLPSQAGVIMQGSRQAGAVSGGRYCSTSSRELNMMFPRNSHLGRAGPCDSSHSCPLDCANPADPSSACFYCHGDSNKGQNWSVLGFFLFNLIFMSILHLSVPLNFQLKPLKVGMKKATFVWRTVNCVQ